MRMLSCLFVFVFFPATKNKTQGLQALLRIPLRCGCCCGCSFLFFFHLPQKNVPNGLQVLMRIPLSYPQRSIGKKGFHALMRITPELSSEIYKPTAPKHVGGDRCCCCCCSCHRLCDRRLLMCYLFPANLLVLIVIFAACQLLLTVPLSACSKTREIAFAPVPLVASRWVHCVRIRRTCARMSNRLRPPFTVHRCTE